ncbi:MAG: efflux RND transporter periplasmic adaptor subunit [Saprospiraceae bacterium]
MRHFVFSFGILGLLVASCGTNSKTTAETPTSSAVSDTLLILTAAQEAHIAPEFTKIQKQEINTLIRLSGVVEVAPQGLYVVSAPLGGRLRHTPLTHGMRVRKGEVIATLEDPSYVDLQRDYLQIREELALAETEYRRQAELNPTKTASDKALQQAQSAVETLKIRLHAAAEQVRLLGYDPASLNAAKISAQVSIRAPFDAYVSEINARIGAYVTPEMPLFTLINPQNTHLALQVLEKDLPLLRPGLRVDAWPAYQPEQPATARLKIIGKDIGPDRMAHAHAEWDAVRSDLLHPGMIVNASVSCPSASTPAIPSEALLNYEGRHYIFIHKDKQRYALIPVSPTGLRNERWVGLSDQDYERLRDANIAVKGAYTLLMALKNKEEE